MARETFIDNPAEEDKNCSIHNIFTSLRNEEEEEELDVVLASTDSTAAGGAVHVDYTDVAYLLQWLNDNTLESYDDINAINGIGRSALHTAFHYGAPLEVINGLLGKLNEKAINAIDIFYEYTALHSACIYGASWEVIKGLLDKLDEKVINASNNNGFSALHYACEHGASWEVIKGLLGKLNETAINAINEDGVTALHTACIFGASLEVINGLLDKLDEKVINAITKGGYSAFHYACEYGASLEVINGLLGRLDGKKINAITNGDGKTALHYACANEALEVISAIVTHTHGKKQAYVKNNDGKLPFDIFPADGKEKRKEHLKKFLILHDLMAVNDPTASLYPNQLLQIILNLPSEDRDEFEEFMNHSYFRKTINAEIIQPFSLSILFLDVAVQGLVMAVFSFTINGAVKELPTTSMAGLIPCLLWLLFREIVQYLSATTKFYFGDAANFVDIIQIVLVIVVLLISFIGKGTIDEGLLVACIGVAWTRLIFVISNLHYSLALFVAALLQVSSSCYIELTILAMI
jgi:ankyrin repeat protein